MKKRWIILLTIIMMIAIIIISVVAHRERKFNHFIFPNTLIANNYTEYKRADTIAMVVINKIFMQDTIKLNIYYMTKEMKKNEYEIQKNFFEPHAYNIYIRKKLTKSLKRLIIHDLIHLNQMEFDDLIPLVNDDTRIVYKGDTIDLYQTPYKYRWYEMEASLWEDNVLKNLNKLLYSK
jgi:hypothetical protein